MDSIKKDSIEKQIQLSIISVSCGIFLMMMMIILLYIQRLGSQSNTLFLSYFDEIENQELAEIYFFVNSITNLTETSLVKTVLFPFLFTDKIFGSKTFLEMSINNRLFTPSFDFQELNEYNRNCINNTCLFYSKKNPNSQLDFTKNVFLQEFPLLKSLFNQRIHDDPYSQIFNELHLIWNGSDTNLIIVKNQTLNLVNFNSVSQYYIDLYEKLRIFYSKIIPIENDIQLIPFLLENTNVSYVKNNPSDKIFSYGIYFNSTYMLQSELGIDFTQKLMGNMISLLTNYFRGIDVLYYFDIDNSTFTDLTCNRLIYLKLKRLNQNYSNTLNYPNNGISDCFINNSSDSQIINLNNFIKNNHDERKLKIPIMKAFYYENIQTDFYFKIYKLNRVSGIINSDLQILANDTDSTIFIIKSSDLLETKNDFVVSCFIHVLLRVLMYNFFLWILILIVIIINIFRVIDHICTPINEITELVNSIGNQNQENLEKNQKSKTFSTDDDLNELHDLTNDLIKGFSDKGFREKVDDLDTININDMDSISQIKINNIMIKDDMINSDNDENEIFYYDRIHKNFKIPSARLDSFELSRIENKNQNKINIEFLFSQTEKLKELEMELGKNNIFYDYITDNIFDEI